jgi:helicase
VSLNEVGRVRARALFNAGFTNIEAIMKEPQAKIAAVQKIGPTIAEKIKDQLKKKSN